jgi:hypothetical protein
MNELQITMDIGGLERFARALVDQSEEDAVAAVRFVSKKLLTKIIDRMPVKMGRARAGWKEAGEALGVAVPDAEAGASQAGDSQYSERWEGMRFVAEMVNGVPYVVYLEYGLSPQAPVGMVRISILEVVANNELGRDLEERLKQSWASLSVSERYARHTVELAGLLEP